MAATIKRDVVKQSWEDTEFPLVCETCLGDNPYVRMTKEAHGKKCQICETPFTVFAWQAGTKGRVKRVEICRNCASAKNVCQVCIYDLQYGLPVKVRDKILRESASATSSTALAVPQSTANRAWFSAQQERALAQGNHPTVDTVAHAKLSEMAQMEPRYERNLPKLCSFYARGECNRGLNCPFRHEMPRDRNDGMGKQSTRNRFFGTSDPVANKILGRRQRQLEQAVADDATYERARATLYVRFRDDDASAGPAMEELALRDVFYAYGEIVSVRVQPEKGQAFVEYSTPEATELAIASVNNRELLGRKVYVAWARAPKRGESSSSAGATHNSNTNDAASSTDAPPVVRLLPPPGAAASSAKASSAGVPTGRLVVKPPPEVAAIAAARRQRLASSGGGGPIRRAVAAPPRYRPYPSADPQRLGTKTNTQESSS